MALAGDTGGTWPFTGTLGTGTLQNSQCRINLATSTITTSGNILTLALDITFLAGLPGPQQVWMLCGDNGGLTDGANWQQMGTWTTTTVSSQAPVPVSVSPTSGTGISQTFQYVGSSDKGAVFITGLHALFSNASGVMANACYVGYNHLTEQLVLLGDSGAWDSAAQWTAWGAGGTTIHNSHCTLNGPASSASSAGNTVTVNLALTFDPSWAGLTKGNYLAVSDRSGAFSSWPGLGTWTIGTPPPPALSIAKTHSGNFAQGQTGAAYTVTVSNGSAAGPTSGTVTVTEAIPSGMTLASMSGTGWTCTISPTCTRSDVLASGASYPPITVTVNVAGNASSPQINSVSVSGGGSGSSNTTDSTVVSVPQTVATPGFSPGAGLYTSAQSVTISSTTSGASIRYTTDGSTPTSTTGNLYGGAVAVNGSMTLKVIAYRSGWTDSPVASAAYTITGTVATPTFSPGGGSYATAQTVTISSTTSGASIRYTTDGSTPTSTTGTLYGGAVAVNGSMTLKAMAYQSGWADSVAASAVYTITGTVATPSFSPGGGSYATAQSVTIGSTTSGASIRYTTDGSTPTSTTGTLYGGAVAVNGSMTLKAIAYQSGWAASAVASAVYTFTGTVATPLFSPNPGTFVSAQNVTISTVTVGASLAYTVDGTTPTHTNGTQVAGTSVTLSVTNTTTVKAIAYKSGSTDSPVASATYTLAPPVLTPTLSPSPGTFNTAQSVTITSVTTGASIRYTTDATMPSESAGTLYNGAVAVNANTTINAIAYKTGMSDSPVASGTYIITSQVGVPSFSPPGGSYSTSQAVTLSNATPGTLMRYTTDGSTPTSASGLMYNGPITITATTILRAIGFKAGWADSAVGSATYAVGVATPSFGLPPGTYGSPQMTSLNSTTPGVAIRYTTDGSQPSATAGNIYSGPIAIPITTTLRAIAYIGSSATSNVGLASYTITASSSTNPVKEYIHLGGRVIAMENSIALAVATPTFSIPGATYPTAQTVTISTSTPGASLAYTVDGSTPTHTNGTQVGSASVAVPISATTTLKAIAYESGWIDSGLSAATYTITGAVATPTFSLPGTAYTTAQTVTISTSTPGASLAYTLDHCCPKQTEI